MGGGLLKKPPLPLPRKLSGKKAEGETFSLLRIKKRKRSFPAPLPFCFG
jgi:hypothetical protein